MVLGQHVVLGAARKAALPLLAYCCFYFIIICSVSTKAREVNRAKFKNAMTSFERPFVMRVAGFPAVMAQNRFLHNLSKLNSLSYFRTLDFKNYFTFFILARIRLGMFH